MVVRMSLIAFWVAFAAAASFSVVPAMAFAPPRVAVPSTTANRNLVIVQARRQARKISENEIPNRKMSAARRQKLGVADDEDEYDLDIALENSTDPLISKIIAGSLIVAITALLYAGIIVPATTDYGEGVCNTILTGGRC
jgi:hypothetical protein